MQQYSPAVRIESLSKSYGKTFAVRDLSFEVRRGEIFGFLGPNGAGKTTTVNIVCGLMQPDAGRVWVNGLSVSSQYRQVKQAIGVCPQDIVIWEKLTCAEQMEFIGLAYGLGRRAAREKSRQLLTTLGLIERKDQKASTLSGGMKRRLNLAMALVHDPQILVLDEPQAGLDPQSRILVREYLRSLTPHTTIILTTHDMDEVERLADRVAIIDQGKLLVLDTPERLKNGLGMGDILEIGLNEEDNDRVRAVVDALPASVQYQGYRGGVLSIVTTRAVEALTDIIKILEKNRVKVEDLRIRGRSLEDVFVSLTGRGLKD